MIAVVFGEYGGKARAERAAELLDEGFAAVGPATAQPAVTLANVASGQSYPAPLDMRPYVCGRSAPPLPPRRTRTAAEIAGGRGSRRI